MDDLDRTGAGVPLLVDLQPAGRHLMEDFHRAGGLLAVLLQVQDLLDPTALTVTGRPLVDHLSDAQTWDTEIIRPRDQPLHLSAGIAVFSGNLVPRGAVTGTTAQTGTPLPSASIGERITPRSSSTRVSCINPSGRVGPGRCQKSRIRPRRVELEKPT